MNKHKPQPELNLLDQYNWPFRIPMSNNLRVYYVYDGTLVEYLAITYWYCYNICFYDANTINSFKEPHITEVIIL